MIRNWFDHLEHRFQSGSEKRNEIEKMRNEIDEDLWRNETFSGRDKNIYWNHRMFFINIVNGTSNGMMWSVFRIQFWTFRFRQQKHSICTLNDKKSFVLTFCFYRSLFELFLDELFMMNYGKRTLEMFGLSKLANWEKINNCDVRISGETFWTQRDKKFCSEKNKITNSNLLQIDRKSNFSAGKFLLNSRKACNKKEKTRRSKKWSVLSSCSEELWNIY